MVYGVVDIGSNTVRLNVYQVEENDLKVLFNKKYTAGLAGYIEDGRLSQKGIRRLIHILSSLQTASSIIAMDDLFVFATASLRKTSNGLDVIKQVHKELGIEIDFISEVEEARLGYAGIQAAYPDFQGASLDIGGGSTEIVMLDKDKKRTIYNVNEGGLSLFTKQVERILPDTKEIRKMEKRIDKKLKKLVVPQYYNQMIGIGGTLRAAGNIAQELWDLESNTQIPVDYLKTLLKLIQNRDHQTIRTILQVNPARIHTFTPGLLIFLEVAQRLQVKELLVCNYGLREGYLIQKLGREKNAGQ